MLAEYRLGATISLTGLDRTSKPLRELCASLERRFSAVFQVNAYLTPALSQGFDTHCDAHDVFVLQIQGTKRWKVFDAPVELPVEFRKVRNAGELPVLLEVELQPGDLLYLPRGYPHHAVSAEATSLHVTVGAHTQTWATLVRAAVEECVHRDVRFRTSLPPEFATTEAGRRSAVDAEGAAGPAQGGDRPSSTDDRRRRTCAPAVPVLVRRLVKEGLLTVRR